MNSQIFSSDISNYKSAIKMAIYLFEQKLFDSKTQDPKERQQLMIHIVSMHNLLESLCETQRDSNPPPLSQGLGG